MQIIYTISRQRRAALALACLFTLAVPAVYGQNAGQNAGQNEGQYPGQSAGQPAGRNGAGAGPAANGPQAGDPSRWYVDDATQADQLRTLRKEIGAALGEAQKECRTRPQSERTACLKDAQEVYRRDMAGVQRQRAAAHPQGPATAVTGQ